jgi:hypothetical protein
VLVRRRPPPEHRTGDVRPRVTLVTGRWGNETDERQWATRLVAGALAARSIVSVIHVTPDPGPFPVRRDGAFTVRRLAGTPANPMRQLLLLTALRSDSEPQSLPPIAGSELHSLDGGWTSEIAAAIAETRPDAIVVAGLQQAWPSAVLLDLSPRPRIAVLPLTGDDPRLGLPGYHHFLEAADVVCTVTLAERDRVLNSLPRLQPGDVRHIPLALGVNRAAVDHRLVGLTSFSDYVLFLRGFPGGTPETEPALDHRRLRRDIGGSAVAEVATEAWRISDRGRSSVVRVAPSRINLLRLMSHATATVDLRPPALLAREVLESLLVGTPVVAQSGSVAAEHVAQSGGGTEFGHYHEMVAAVRELRESSAREEIAARGRSWASEQHGDQRRFVQVTGDAVLGES